VNAAQLAQNLTTSLDRNDAALLVTSNGILKFFLKLVPGAFDEMGAKGALKVATGNCCALAFEAGNWRLMFWNRQPPSLAFD
jgi:probable phosphoglycerate mutase